METNEPLSVMLLSFKWSPPADFATLPDVKPTSLPKPFVFLGPDNNIPPSYDDPLSCWYIQLLFNESHNNEPVCPIEPESNTANPPNL